MPTRVHFRQFDVTTVQPPSGLVSRRIVVGGTLGGTDEALCRPVQTEMGQSGCLTKAGRPGWLMSLRVISRRIVVGGTLGGTDEALCRPVQTEMGQSGCLTKAGRPAG